jgi:hypothetical protein
LRLIPTQSQMPPSDGAVTGKESPLPAFAPSVPADESFSR